MKIKKIYENDGGTMYNVVSKEWHDINYVDSKPDISRGGHYHKETVEAFFIIEGQVQVTMENFKTHDAAGFKAEALDYFEIQPYWTHTVKTLKPTKWVAFLSQKFDEKNPDIHKPSK